MTKLKINLSSATIEPIRLVFCGSTRHVYDALVQKLLHSLTATCQVTANEIS
ncbi:Uncharacterised protein [Klebsiella michiganensis]|uniref:Uncharacterized protein n=1 Tax=Klebsiella michiganensis TaxID=1134687 RepID=A0A7H4LWF4_9ENTR|nr:Uncharacterised protein [Klebsiella michiganensis]